jgi:hypothetical protein
MASPRTTPRSDGTTPWNRIGKVTDGTGEGWIQVNP